jgi:hypothetical protein
MPVAVEEWTQLVVAVVAILGGLITAGKAVTELRQANQQKREDLRWKQAEMAKQCVDEIFTNSFARAAVKMLDWSGRHYDLPGGGKTTQITDDVRRKALRTQSTEFSPNDSDSPFIRDAYDNLFDGLERLEHFITIELIRFEDVEPAFSYHVRKMASIEERPIIELFLESYGFTLGQRFLERFPEWRAA